MGKFIFFTFKAIPKKYLNLLILSFVFSGTVPSLPAIAKDCSPNEISQILGELGKNSSKLFTNAANCFNAVPNYIEIFNDSEDPIVRLNTASILEDMGHNASAAVPTLVAALDSSRDPDDSYEPDERVRARVAYALGNIGDISPEVVYILLEAMQSDPELFVRRAAASSLGTLKAQPKIVLPVLFEALADETGLNNDDDLDVEIAFAFAAYELESTPYLKDLQTFVQSPDYSSDVKLAIAKAINTISLAKYEKLNVETSNLFSIWLKSGNLRKASAEFSETMQALSAPELAESYREIERYKTLIDRKLWLSLNNQGLQKIYFIIGAHASVWLLLVFAYPRFPLVQAAFFWNPRIRRILGFPYVTTTLKWATPFRQILFIPFKDSLRSDANLDLFDTETYFADLYVKAEGGSGIQPIEEVISQLKGQIVLQGESGSGKSMFLRHLLKQSSKIAVYLPAHKCANGVTAAIQAKLYGQAQDADFLRDLIYSGAIDIYIDGLNEVTPDTRASIKEFVEKNFKGNIILTTQPLEWKPPGKVYHLQPLSMEQVGAFLVQHRPATESTIETPEAKPYPQACAAYLHTIQAELESDLIPADEKTALRQSLSNPLDLTVVAQLIASQQQPNLLQLREQQYATMTADYQRIYLGRSFPLVAFAEMAYQLRLNIQTIIPEAEFAEELLCLERHKMVVRRQQDTEASQWLFRHEKIADFFVAQAFLQESDLQTQHFADSRFRGVYLLLANLLPEPQRMALREQLIQYAAKYNDHVLSDAFIQRVGCLQL